MSNATKIDVYLKNPDGTPLTNTRFIIKPVRAGFWSSNVGLVEDKELIYSTDLNGYVQMELMPLPYPYIMTYSYSDDAIPGHFLFYVPAIDSVVNFQDLIVTKADSNDKYADTVLAQIIAAKVATLAAAADAAISAEAAKQSELAAKASEEAADSDATQTGVDRTQVNSVLSDISAMSSAMAIAMAKIQAIDLQNKLVLGGYQLWVDATGKLRIVQGTPTGDLDGTVVGTQTN